MKEYLKMADVITGSVVNSGSTLMDATGLIAEVYGPTVYSTFVSHAINSHDELVAMVERLRSVMQECCDALYIADKFCGNHTADECDDSIAIPIRDALVEAAKELAK